MDQGAAFNDFDDALKLAPEDRRDAESLHGEMTDHLKAEGVIIGGFLQGSFARKTMRAPLHDVDKVLLLPSALAWLRREVGGPDRAMDMIEASVRRRFDGVTFDRKKHALQIQVPDCPFHFDAVPAFDLEEGGDSDVLIANREAVTLDTEWERSNTRLLIRTVADRNQECGGWFVHWVRMGKEMVHHLLDGSLPGLHTESLCFLANTQAVGHPEACRRLFETGAQFLGTRYTDPTGAEVISERLDSVVAFRARAVFASCAAQAHEAQSLSADGDTDNACRIWHDIFGDGFPAPEDQRPEEALAASFAGAAGITSIGTVTRSRAARQPSGSTRPWAP